MEVFDKWQVEVEDNEVEVLWWVWCAVANVLLCCCADMCNFPAGSKRKVGEWGGAAGGMLGSRRAVARVPVWRHPWLWSPSPTAPCEATKARSLSRV